MWGQILLGTPFSKTTILIFFNGILSSFFFSNLLNQLMKFSKIPASLVCLITSCFASSSRIPSFTFTLSMSGEKIRSFFNLLPPFFFFMSKTVIISGGTSGIGKAAVLQLLKDGFNVATFSRDKNKCNALVEELKEKHDPNQFIVMDEDITDEKNMLEFVSATISKFKTIDILINNAGFGYFEDSDKVDLEKFQSMIQTNLVGVAILTKQVVPNMMENKSGLIINVVSMSGKRSYPRGEFYGATKFGLMGYSDGIRKELQEHNIKVSTVCPGVVDTDFFSEKWKKEREEKGEPMMAPEDISRAISLICRQSEHSNIQHIEVLPF